MPSNKMNQTCSELLQFFLAQYPGMNEEIFQTVVEATLKGHRISENFQNMSSETAVMFRGIFSRVSEKHLEDWFFGILAYQDYQEKEFNKENRNSQNDENH